jgi:DnaJ-class molecular chaperone
MYVTIEVKTPTRLTSRERELLAQLRDADKRTYRKEIDSLVGQAQA